MSSVEHVMSLIKEEDVKFVDLRFTDSRGKEQHVSISANQINENFLDEGKMFDGSSISGWKGISESDMVLKPDLETAILDPFYQDKTLLLRCDILEPATMQGYNRDPRSIAKNAERFLKSSGTADAAYFGPEPEFFILDDVRWNIDIRSASYHIDSSEAAWNSGTSFDGGNLGHRPKVKGGYFPVPPVDSSQDLRSEMCRTLELMGLTVEAHHHEVATGNQNEIATEFNTLVKKADELQILKYVVQNIAKKYGKSATFMPKPIVGDNGNGMHCHQSLSKNGTNLFTGNKYGGLSETALHYIGGLLHHAKAINAFTNGTTNSYKRLVPGFEAPVMLAYSARNRSAAIRIPFVNNANARRIEVRFPDAATNPYLSFAAMLMAGLDGIKKKIHPGEAMDKDLYDLPPEEAKEIPTVCSSLSEAICALDQDREFLLEGNVFSNDFIDSYINLKQDEIKLLNITTHPVEFEMYYSL